MVHSDLLRLETLFFIDPRENDMDTEEFLHLERQGNKRTKTKDKGNNKASRSLIVQTKHLRLSRRNKKNLNAEDPKAERAV